jgi:sugar/nucleoside kinase (ribokinase family)
VIVCIGNALVDALQETEDEIIDELDLNKSRMTLVDEERSNFLLRNMGNPTYAAGGSAANTAFWISQLGGKAGFIGKVSKDKLGEQFKSSLINTNLTDYTVYGEEDIQTGLCVIFITPDGERTMNTFLGAGEFLSRNEINRNSILDAEIVYLEGYLWDKPESKEAFKRASELNTETNGKNAITLSDVFCVERHRESFIEFINQSIDYVFCNEDELKALTELDSTKEAIKYFKDNFYNVEQLICTLGSKGSIVVSDEEELLYKAEETKVIDKTGAGDFFAAGYLYGVQQKLSINDAAEIANKSAAHVISEIGVRPKKEFN